MKYYSKITKKPNSVIKELKNGIKVVKQTRLCVFKNGECEVTDPDVMHELDKHPEYFRTDKPWPVRIEWQDTKEGKELLAKGEKLGIKIKNLRQVALERMINEKENEAGLHNKVKAKVLNKIIKRK